MNLTKLTPFPPNCNPFHHDLFNMGTQMGSNLMIMHSNHKDQRVDSLILVNPITGERWKLDMVEQEEDSQEQEPYIEDKYL